MVSIYDTDTVNNIGVENLTASKTSSEQFSTCRNKIIGYYKKAYFHQHLFKTLVTITKLATRIKMVCVFIDTDTTDILFM